MNATPTPESPGLTRKQIVEKLIEVLEPLPHVLAMWEGGSTGFGRTDEWSDLDLQVDVDDERVADTVETIDRCLETLSPIAQRLEVPHPPAAGIAQIFYRLQATSPYLLVDLCVLRHGAPEKYLAPEIHGQARFYFNKGEAVVVPRLDVDAHLHRMRARLERVQSRFDLFHCMVQKELFRHNLTGALDLYHRLIIDSLVDALRLRHSPAHFDWKLPGVDHDLPPDVVRRLEGLLVVNGPEDLAVKYDHAVRWYRAEIAAVDLAEAEWTLRAAGA